jgi:HEAT repeat protein
MLLSAMGEHFVHKFLEYFDRNEMVSFAIKHDIERDEFNRFMGAVVERRLDIGEQAVRGKRPPFDEILSAVQVVHIAVMCRDELVGGKRRIPWAVKVALSRLRKDLKMVPLYCRSTRRELSEVRTMLVQDVIRPLRRVDLMRDLILNADLIAAEISEDSGIDIETEIVRDMHADMASSLAKLAADELFGIRAGEITQTQGFGTIEVREERLLFAIHQIARHFFRAGGRYDVTLIRQLYERKVLDVSELPSEIRRAVRLERWTDQFLHDPRSHLERLASIAEPAAYSELLVALRLVFAELVCRRLFKDALQIVSSLDRQLREPTQAFQDRKAMLRECLDRMCTSERLRPVVEALKTPGRDDRGVILRLLSLLGAEAVPTMLEALLFVEDAATRRELCTMIEHVGAPAGQYLLMEAESFNHKWYFYRNVVMLLGKIRHAEGAQPAVRLLAHFHPRVREEAAQAVARILRRDAVPFLVPLLDDADPSVVRRVVSSLRTLRTRDERYLDLLRETLAGDPAEKDPALVTTVIRALRDVGNVTLPAADEGAEPETVEQVMLAMLEPARRRLFRQRSRVPAEIRAALCETLGAIGTRLSEPALRGLMDDEAEDVRSRAEAAHAMLSRRLERVAPRA